MTPAMSDDSKEKKKPNITNEKSKSDVLPHHNDPKSLRLCFFESQTLCNYIMSKEMVESIRLKFVILLLCLCFSWQCDAKT